MTEMLEEVRTIADENFANGNDWRMITACSTVNPDIFTASDGESSGDRKIRERVAVAICNTCAVVDPCREKAVTTARSYDELVSVRGARTPSELKRLRRGRLATEAAGVEQAEEAEA